MSALAFELPGALEAPEPPEARGLRRDEVRLMVASRGDGRVRHARFLELNELLSPGDLLVVNVSATLPAAISARRDGGAAAKIHVASRAPRLDPTWRVVELRSADGSRPGRGRPGEVITLRGGAELELVAPYASTTRLMLGRYGGGSLEDYLYSHGEPIRYSYVNEAWPLVDYQTVFATAPGSAEMPSAGRPFSRELVTRLVARGILIAPVTLHTGLSSPERHEPPVPELFEVPVTTADTVNAVHARGGRVIAVGTTVVRALESVARRDHICRAGSGWTNLVVTASRGMRLVDGLITGWHEPQASHLQLLEASAGAALLDHCYREALSHRYLWHEFGDSHLILP